MVAALACGSTYPESVDSDITYGPFSTENGYVNGEVKFKFWLNSEAGWDYLWVTAGTGGSSEWGIRSPAIRAAGSPAP